jgi:hypothetical protein
MWSEELSNYLPFNSTWRKSSRTTVRFSWGIVVCFFLGKSQVDSNICIPYGRDGPLFRKWTVIVDYIPRCFIPVES